MNAPSEILAGSFRGVDWLRVEGRGSFENSADLKAFANARMERGQRKFVLDLANCTGMDSTFMGTLTGVAVKLADDDGCLQVVNAAGRNGELLRGLGLDAMFPVEDGPGDPVLPVAAEAVPRRRCTRQERTAVCLEAHEALAAVRVGNEDQFRSVIELMRESMSAGNGRE